MKIRRQDIHDSPRHGPPYPVVQLLSIMAELVYSGKPFTLDDLSAYVKERAEISQYVVFTLFHTFFSPFLYVVEKDGGMGYQFRPEPNDPVYGKVPEKQFPNGPRFSLN